MKEQEKILTLHPQGKKGVNISKKKYDQIVTFILKTIQLHQEITFMDLTDLAVDELTDKFDGKVVWYLVSVKLELEARHLIERIPRKSPQRLRMVKS